MIYKTVFAVRQGEIFEDSFSIESVCIPWNPEYPELYREETDQEYIDSTIDIFGEFIPMIPEDIKAKVESLKYFPLRIRYNNMFGPYMIESEFEMTPDDIHAYLKSLGKRERKTFLKKCEIKL